MNKTKQLSTFAQGKTCPLQLEEKFIPCDITDLEPIVEYLENNNTSNETITFTKGTVIDGHRLDLCKQRIGPEGTRKVTDALLKNNNITSLMLGADGILNEGAIAVSELIKQNESIETVYLGCNLIDEKGISALADSLSNNQKVKGLWLKRNPIGDQGIEKIAEMLKINSSITSLDLVNTDFSIVGLKKLIKVLLEDNNSINRIYFGGNHIDSEGAYQIAFLLTKPNIECLYLNVNNIGDQGAIYLSKTLKKNTTLKELGLASNNISSVGAKNIFDSLMLHPSIQVLDFGYSPSTKVLGEKANIIDDQSVDIICQFLAKNKSLISLDLTNNLITKAGLEKIVASLENNHNIIKFTINTKKAEEIKLKLKEIIKRNLAKSNLDLLKNKNNQEIRSFYRT